MATNQKSRPLGSMTMETASFLARLKVLTEGLSREMASITLVKINARLVEKIIAKNPVKTGYSRAGWFPAANYLGVPTPGAPEAGAESKGRAMGDIIVRATVRTAVIEIINKVPHVQLLEYGHSKQAPMGMVRLSMREIEGEIPTEISATLRRQWTGAGLSVNTRI